MTGRQFIQQLKKEGPGAGYLFVGAELFLRDRCRTALKDAVLPAGSQDSLVEIDLKQESLPRLLDETRTLSLFASERLIVGVNAEGALPRAGTKAAKELKGQMVEYFSKPTPGVTVLLECTRFDSQERDDKAKIERVVKFYQPVPVTVELNRLSATDALRACTKVAKDLGLEVGQDVLVELVEMLAADMGRLERELEKLKVYKPEGAITRADLDEIVPEAKQSGVFELSEALARKDRSRALETLNNLASAGTYWPFQLSFLGSLFRQALAVKELKVRNANAVTAELGRRGVRVWPSRARQLLDIAGMFSRKELGDALIGVFEADRDLRRERPEDRIIMERLVVRLTR